MWFSVDQNLLASKPVSRWGVDDVTLWVEQLGDWTKQYRETFRQEQISGRYQHTWRCVFSSLSNITFWHEYEVSSTVFICHMFVRLLSVLRAEDLSVEPFRIKDPLHRRAFLQEIQNIQHLRVKAPGNLWEYKVCLSQKCFNKHEITQQDKLQNDVELSLNCVLSFCLCRHRI